MNNSIDKKWGIVYCPKSGLRPHKRWEKIEKSLRAHEIEFDMVQSENSAGVERLVTMMINNGYKTLVVVGGDSALNDAVNCLMQAEKSVRDNWISAHRRCSCSLASNLRLSLQRCSF